MKLFHVIATSVLGAAMAFGTGFALANKQSVRQARADTINFELSSASSVTKDGVTVSFAKGNGSNDPAWYNAGLRLYLNNTLTITSSESITGVSFNWEKQGSKTFITGCTSSVGTYTHPSQAGVGTWSGSATSITFTLGGSGQQLQLNTFSVTTGGSVNPEPAVVDTTLAGFISATTPDNTVIYHFEASIKAFKSGSTKDKYGNLTLTDGTNDLTVYGSTATTGKLSWNGSAYTFSNPQDFMTNAKTKDLKINDIVEVNFIRYLYNSKLNAQGIILNSSTPAPEPAAKTIQEIYSKPSGTSVDVYGYYVDLMDNKNMIVMDGDYGIDVYQSSDFNVTGYEKEITVLHLEGEISIYHGLYELVNTTITIIDDESVIAGLGISKPVVYAAKGGETAEYANRVTTVTGVVTALDVENYEWDGTSDVTITVTIGSKTVDVFYKKAAQNATDGGKIDASLAGASEITFKGFTNWHDGFQVRMTGLVEAVDTYTAEIFAQDLMDQTDAVCAGYEEGDNNHDAIVAIWSDLASADKYPSLPADQKAILAAADADEHSSDVVEQAMARYDFLTVRYNLNNFINGRLGGSETNTINTISHSSDLAAIIVTISVVVLVSSVGFFLVIRKRKHQ